MSWRKCQEHLEAARTWEKDCIKNECCDNATRVAQYAQSFKPRHWSFLVTWYFWKRSEGGEAALNTILNLSEEVVMELTRHEASDLFDQVSRNGQRSVHKNTSVEFKSHRQVCREARLSKSMEVGQFFETLPAIALGRTRNFRDNVYWETTQSPGPSTMQEPICNTQTVRH